MSNGYALRSTGRPYFAMVQQTLAYMNAPSLPAFGALEWVVEFRLDSVPIQLASADECHAIASFHEYASAGARRLLDVGISPSGRVQAAHPLGVGVQTAPGRVQADGAWHRLIVSYDAGAGDWRFNLDSDAQLSPNDGGAGGFLLPAAGFVGEVTLFNGLDGLSRAGVTIRLATLGFTPGPNAVTWATSEGLGAVVRSTRTGLAQQDFTLTAQLRDPITTHPWGPVDLSQLDGAYAWQIATAYTESGAPATVYAETQA